MSYRRITLGVAERTAATGQSASTTLAISNPVCSRRQDKTHNCDIVVAHPYYSIPHRVSSTKCKSEVTDFGHNFSIPWGAQIMIFLGGFCHTTTAN